MDRFWRAPEDDPMRDGAQYYVLCCIETDRSLHVLFRNTSPGPDANGEPNPFITVEVDPPLTSRGVTGQGDRTDGLWVATFDPPASDVNRVDVTVTLKSFRDPAFSEHYSTTTVTRQHLI